MLILIVDDDDVIREMLEIALRSFGFTVETAASGDEALNALRRGPVDLVVMDVQMPGMDGPTTFAAMKASDPDVACCFISANMGNYTLGELTLMGAVGFLQKPFQLEELRKMIVDAVG